MSEAARFDACAASYDAALQRGLSMSGESKDYFIRGRIEWLSKRLQQHACRPRHVLDYGCGTGATAPALVEDLGAASVTGVDVSSDSIDIARKHYADGNVRFTTMDQWQPAGEYDLAYCNGVFHHIEPALRRRALADISRALSPRGYFAFCENNPWNPGTRLVMSRISFDRDANMLSARHARKLLAGAGFEIITTDFLFFFPRALAILRPLEPGLTRVPVGGQYMVLCRKRA
jgi:ubiquinone/menaquinone biosynthesis C-methylase UbiE